MKPSLLALLLGSWAAATTTIISLPSTPCQVEQIPIRTSGASVFTLVRVSKSCNPSKVFRVRKSSTISTKGNGSPVQPIKPLRGAWEVSRYKNTIPVKPLDERWALNTWEWQYYDPAAINPLTGGRGAWERIPLGSYP